jgi:hypothetical protein
MEKQMKVWKVTWKDKKGFLKYRYRSSRSDALTRVSRAKKEGSEVTLNSIQIPTSRFDLIDFLNSEMDAVDVDTEVTI